MANNLVIVESPTKVKTIRKFLGNNYTIDASNGHVRDLPKSKMGIDIENDYEPMYITIRGKGELLSKLRKEVKKADKIYLATDPDREGEAISWHLTKALKLSELDKPVYRVTFNEITKNAVKESFKSPREIDMNLVDAQQARRVLDRVVGYSISPLLWSKVKRGLSAGRVQSVALRMICDREALIDAFIPEEYWSIDAYLTCKGNKKPLKATLSLDKDGKKIDIKNESECNEIVSILNNATYKVTSITSGNRNKKAPLPFTTSTMQQEASKALNFSTQKTMRMAQQLYEGVDIEGHGSIGLITYLRTDSTRISKEADIAAKEYISNSYGSQYVAEHADSSKKSSQSHIQDAHEAIRPTDVALTPVAVKESLSRDQFRLYQLIWKRFVASRMKPAIYDIQSVKIDAAGYTLTMSTSRISFDGFMNVYIDADDHEEKSSIDIGNIEEGEALGLEKLDPQQHFTQAPAHYTEASLVKAMEEIGIGRPSTYAPTISTILGRHYVTKEQKNLYITELGQVVNDIMVKEFPDIVDEKFTSNMEHELDEVGEGRLEWKKIIENFYPKLEESVKKAEKELESVKIADEESDEICDKCGRRMVIKYGPHGKFLACPGFPDCKNTKPYFEKIGISCPKCGKDVVLKKSKKGRIFYGCLGNPECDFISWNRPTGHNCPKCGEYMVQKGKKEVCSNPKCGYSENIQ